ncbi:MAG: iron-sulfur cluster assembly protein [Elusimicrobiota bacterium]
MDKTTEAAGFPSPFEAGANRGPFVKDIARALEPVMDPEIHVSIVELGLIYGIEIEGGKVRVLMTLTTPMCPYGPMLQDMTRQAAQSVAGVEEAVVQLVWDPVWDPKEMCGEDAKVALGLLW